MAAGNDFGNFVAGLDSPAGEAWEITSPNDGVDLVKAARALYVGGAGNLAVMMQNGGTVTFTNVPAGSFLPIRVARVMLTGTTATGILGLR